MVLDLQVRILNRVALPVCIAVLASLPAQAANVDVFALLTGQQPPAAALAAEFSPQQAFSAAQTVASEPDYILTADAEEVARGAESAYREMSLSRPLGGLNVSPSTPEFASSMANIPEQFSIRDVAESKFGDWASPHLSIATLSSGYTPSEFFWAAPAVYHGPLYFEQPNVERYGHYVALCEGGNCLQSAICAAHFFATVPLLPYKVGADPCGECQYVLGTYRPGSCNPNQLVKPECSACGLTLQGVTVTGLIFLFP